MAHRGEGLNNLTSPFETALSIWGVKSIFVCQMLLGKERTPGLDKVEG